MISGTSRINRISGGGLGRVPSAIPPSVSATDMSLRSAGGRPPVITGTVADEAGTYTGIGFSMQGAIFVLGGAAMGLSLSTSSVPGVRDHPFWGAIGGGVAGWVALALGRANGWFTF